MSCCSSCSCASCRAAVSGAQGPTQCRRHPVCTTIFTSCVHVRVHSQTCGSKFTKGPTQCRQHRVCTTKVTSCVCIFAFTLTKQCNKTTKTGASSCLMLWKNEGWRATGTSHNSEQSPFLPVHIPFIVHATGPAHPRSRIIKLFY